MNQNKTLRTNDEHHEILKRFFMCPGILKDTVYEHIVINKKNRIKKVKIIKQLFPSSHNIL
jgi:hypothetical protein